MNDLSKRIAALTPEQQALLHRRLKQPPRPVPPAWAIPNRTELLPTVEAADGRCHLPVSFAQQRMWFQDQLGNKSAVSNNIAISLKITGALQVRALEQSLREILQRHEILRTTLQTVAGELTQTIAVLDQWALTLVDLRSLPSLAAQELAGQRLALEQACQPFDLATDLLMRTTLLQLETDHHVLLLTLHHVAVDAWSIGVFFRELSALYAAFSAGQPVPLAALAIQYADYAVWQRHFLQGDLLADDLAYWRQKLQDAPDLLSLPSDRARPAVQSFTGKTRSFLVPKPLTEALRQLAQQTESTLFMTLLAALQTLLFRYSGQDDILVGSPIANRQQPEIEPLIGCFINTLVLRTDLSGNPSFRALLRRVRTTVLEALAHQALPFEKLVDELQLARNLAYAPLFQVMLVLQNAFSIHTIELPGLQVEHDRIDNHTAQFDLTLHLVESDNGLIGKLEYNTDLFDEATIVRWLAHFQTLLAGIVANPEQRLSALPLLTATEQQQLFLWNQTEHPFAATASMQSLFEAQVQKTPEAIAVVFEAQAITYRELNERANQLAHALQKLGVQPERLVGICVERSPALIVGLLGILKAGGVYVPIDPTYPAQRLNLILADAQVAVLLTQQSLAAKLSQVTPPRLYLDTDWDKIELESAENLVAPVLAENLAYVIYTSGSTGTPKGVMVSHQSLVNYSEAAIADYQITAVDRVLQFASISFDAAAEEIFPCLLQGATLVLRTEVMLSSIAGFLQACRDWQVTVLDLPTAFWHQLVTEMAAQDLRLPEAVRLVIIGGEKALRDRFALWQQRVGAQVRLVNSYGPTEATIVTTTMELSGQSPTAFVDRELPIGRPVRNAKVYVLDADRQLAPIGVPGELYIGGCGVARGYLNRPDLTAQAFIRDRFSPDPAARCYKTGDRGRYRTDGTLEFWGRIDQQVKLRGFRIELGEIEALLTQHPEVQTCLLVCDCLDAIADSRLIAYVVPVVGCAPTSRQLRQFLEKRLPKYMVPAAFVLLARLPLNANGKVDRQRLPMPEQSRAEVAAEFVAPSSATEITIAQIFARVLQVEFVGVDDDFFELGGHSLLATKLIAQLLAAFQVALTIVDLFQSPTVAGLAARVEHLQTLAAASGESLMQGLQRPLARRSPAMPVPLSFSQQYIWGLQDAGNPGAALNSSIILRVKAALTHPVLEQSLNEIVRRHEILRTVFRLVEGQPKQIGLHSLHLPLDYVDLQAIAPAVREAEAFSQAIAIAQPPFDLLTAPLLRTALLRLAPQEHWLVITMHHIITDGWSFGVLLQELDTLVQAFAAGRPSPLPDLALQYADFAEWQQQVYTEAEMARQLAYWHRKLGADDRRLEPESFAALTLSSRQADHYFTQLPEALTGTIAALSRTLGVTSFVVLLAALKLALAAWSGQRDIWIVTTVGNRTVPETEPLIGCFINDVIVRSQLLPEQTGVQLIKQLQADVQAAIAHKEVSIEQVIEQVKRSRPLQFMASLTLTGSVQQVEQLPDWEVVAVQTQPQQFDQLASELYAEDTPLEIYIELSQPIQIGVNYSVQLFTPEKMARLFAHYQEILTLLALRPAAQLSELWMA